MEILTYNEWKGSEDYWKRLEDTFNVDSETDLETHDITTEDLYDLYNEYQIEEVSKESE